MAKYIRGYFIIFTNTAFVFEKKNRSSSFFQDSKILISPMRKIIFSISFQENVDTSSFETEDVSSKGPCVFCCGHCFYHYSFWKEMFVLSKLLNIYCKFVKSVSIHLHQIPAAVKKYAVYPLLKYTNKTFFTLWIKNYKSSFRYQFPHKYISHFDVMYKKKNENDTHVLSRIIPFEYPADSLIRKKHNLRHKTQERPLNVNRSL